MPPESSHDEPRRASSASPEDAADAAPPPPGASWFAHWANTPFVVTLLGGLLGTGITIGWKAMEDRSLRQLADAKADADARLQRDQRQYDATYNLLVKFAAELPGALQRFYDVQIAYAWLHENGSQLPRHERKGKSYQEIWADYEALKRELGKHPSVQSFAPQILATFQSKPVLALATELRDAITRMGEADTASAINRDLYRANQLFIQLVPAMGDEIRLNAKKISP